MSERDELGKLISSRHTMAAVDAILDAGYRKPRVIETRDELDALWLGSVVLSEGCAFQRYGSLEWYAEGCVYATGEIKLPATVISDPSPYRSGE